ncbi:lipopolysaccharide biosynthesis protein [Nocardioides sp. AX2bis]|uniref:lipopolysaccharide biosynthesis protein n=1 Tax=Nocardioides sp. AX2bis TaxID=2653157 RepID=UPI00135B2896|nr:lipopolysaccharide biosynthesis protein [Nocardioides sp. AX2bis]
MRRQPRPRASVLAALRWFVVSYGLAVTGYVAINAMVSRWLGLDGFADFVIILTVATGLGQLALVGVHRGGLREAAKLTESPDAEVLATLRAGVQVAARGTLPAVGVLSGAVVYAVVGGNEVERILLGVSCALLVVLNGLQKLWANYLRGFGEIRLAGLLEGRSGGGLVSLCQAVAVLVIWVAFPGTGLVGALGALIIGFTLPVLYGGHRVNLRWGHVQFESHFISDLRTTVAANWRFAVNHLGAFLGTNIELWLAGLLLASSQASLFSAAQRIALLLVIPLISAQVVFAPVCARLLATGEIRRLQSVLRTGATVALLVSAVLLTPILLAPDRVVALVFGDTFEGAALPLLILSISSVANVATGLSGIALTMSHREGVAAAIQAATVVAQVVVGVAAALVWGLNGLAVSATTFVTLNYVGQWIAVRRLLGLWTQPTFRPRFGDLRRAEG